MKNQNKNKNPKLLSSHMTPASQFVHESKSYGPKKSFSPKASNENSKKNKSPSFYNARDTHGNVGTGDDGRMNRTGHRLTSYVLEDELSIGSNENEEVPLTDLGGRFKANDQDIGSYQEDDSVLAELDAQKRPVFDALKFLSKGDRGSILSEDAGFGQADFKPRTKSEFALSDEELRNALVEAEALFYIESIEALGVGRKKESKNQIKKIADNFRKELGKPSKDILKNYSIIAANARDKLMPNEERSFEKIDDVARRAAEELVAQTAKNFALKEEEICLLYDDILKRSNLLSEHVKKNDPLAPHVNEAIGINQNAANTCQRLNEYVASVAAEELKELGDDGLPGLHRLLSSICFRLQRPSVFWGRKVGKEGIGAFGNLISNVGKSDGKTSIDEFIGYIKLAQSRIDKNIYERILSKHEKSKGLTVYAMESLSDFSLNVLSSIGNAGLLSYAALLRIEADTNAVESAESLAVGTTVFTIALLLSQSAAHLSSLSLKRDESIAVAHALVDTIHRDPVINESLHRMVDEFQSQTKSEFRKNQIMLGSASFGFRNLIVNVMASLFNVPQDPVPLLGFSYFMFPLLAFTNVPELKASKRMFEINMEAGIMTDHIAGVSSVLSQTMKELNIDWNQLSASVTKPESKDFEKIVKSMLEKIRSGEIKGLDRRKTEEACIAAAYIIGAIGATAALSSAFGYGISDYINGQHGVGAMINGLGNGTVANVTSAGINSSAEVAMNATNGFLNLAGITNSTIKSVAERSGDSFLHSVYYGKNDHISAATMVNNFFVKIISTVLVYNRPVGKFAVTKRDRAALASNGSRHLGALVSNGISLLFGHKPGLNDVAGAIDAGATSGCGVVQNVIGSESSFFSSEEIDNLAFASNDNHRIASKGRFKNLKEAGEEEEISLNDTGSYQVLSDVLESHDVLREKGASLGRGVSERDMFDLSEARSSEVSVYNNVGDVDEEEYPFLGAEGGMDRESFHGDNHNGNDHDEYYRHPFLDSDSEVLLGAEGGIDRESFHGDNHNGNDHDEYYRHSFFDSDSEVLLGAEGGIDRESFHGDNHNGNDHDEYYRHPFLDSGSEVWTSDEEVRKIMGSDSGNSSHGFGSEDEFSDGSDYSIRTDHSLNSHREREQRRLSRSSRGSNDGRVY